MPERDRVPRVSRLRRAVLGRVRDMGARAVARRLAPLSSPKRLAFFNVGTTNIDPTVIVSCSYATRGQLKSLARRVRRVSRAVVRLRFGRQWVSLLDLDVIGSTHAEIVMTALHAAGARVVLHPSVCHALRPGLNPGDVCVLAEADADEDPVCRAYGVAGVVSADPVLAADLIQALEGLAPRHGIRVFRARSATLPVFVNVHDDLLRRLSGKADLFDLEVATIYALAERFGMRALSVKMVAGCRTDETDIFTTPQIRIEDMLRKGERVLQCLVDTLIVAPGSVEGTG